MLVRSQTYQGAIYQRETEPQMRIESLDPRQLDNFSFVKIPRLNIFSENCEEKFPKGFRFGQKLE